MSNSFQNSVEYLFALGNEVLAMKLGLENIRKLLEALGRPQDKYLKVQVAGTNGKGSVCAFLNSICVQAGVKTGMFTSPHLISITERVQINGDDISEDQFARLATRVRETCQKLVDSGELENTPTFFEQVTAIALLAFADAKVELAILETGLGGRLDATTAADAEIAAITRIDLDHQQYLGETIEEIAGEKAAIIRDDSQRVVIGAQRPEALRVILERCKEVGISDLDWEPHLRWTVDSVGSGRVKVATHQVAFADIELGLHGEHQTENAETAVNVVRILRNDFSLSIDDEDLIKGLTIARHPGRLESIGRFLLDGAHNPGGARALREYLEEFEKQPITMVFGAMGDKAVGEIAAILFPCADQLILTRSENQRALSIDDLARLTAAAAPKNVLTANSAEEAIQKAEQVSPDNAVIVVTGSLYLIGEVRRSLTGRDGEIRLGV